jgi:hypothetical protein
MKLYELTDEYKIAEQELNEMLYNDQIDEGTVTNTLESLRGGIEEKAKNIAMYVGNIESTAKAIKEQEKLMKARRERLESQAKSIRDYLKSKMDECEIHKIECPYFAMTIKSNPARLVIDDEQLIPSDYKVEVVTVAIDKSSIKSLLKNGELVDGARLERGTRLEIK